MTKALALGLLVVVLGCLTVVAGPLSGNLSFWARAAVNPLMLLDMESVLEVDYTAGSWTFSSTALAGQFGLYNLYFDVKGVLGGFAVRSIVDFNALVPAFGAMLGSAVTSIGGVNVYGLFLLENLPVVTTASGPAGILNGLNSDGIIGRTAIGSGFTIGGWGTAGSASIWAQVQFNMSDTSGLIYKYGYQWLLDHFIFETCGVWQKPSGYITVESVGCDACWSGADLYVESPFSCFTLLTQLRMSRLGFEQVMFEAMDLDLGLGILDVNWIDVVFATTSKSVNVVFDVNVGKTACITPYFAFDGAGEAITGLSLKALGLEYTWNGVTFKAGELFDVDGWYPYLNYPSERYLGWSWDGELTTLLPCLAGPGVIDSQELVPYNEFLGFIVGSDSCCGGGSSFSMFAWFNAGTGSGLFDWAETRMSLREGIGSNIALTFGMSVTQLGLDWFKLGTEFGW